MRRRNDKPHFNPPTRDKTGSLPLRRHPCMRSRKRRRNAWGNVEGIGPVGERCCLLRALSRQACVASEPERHIPAPRPLASRDHSWRDSAFSDRNYSGALAVAKAALPRSGLVLVSRHTSAGDWPHSGRASIHGRSL
jgi:hypothetical protein